MIKNLILAGTGLLFVSCGNDVPDEVTQFIIAGTWSGTVTSSQNASTGGLSLSLTQSGESLTGSISTPNSPVGGGIIEGDVPLGQRGFDFEVKDREGELVAQFSGSVEGVGFLVGTFNMWDATTNALLDTGTFVAGGAAPAQQAPSGSPVLLIDPESGDVQRGVLVDNR